MTRLLEMGVEPYLLASAITGILAQLLVREICETGKEPSEVPSAMQTLFGRRTPENIYKGMG